MRPTSSAARRAGLAPFTALVVAALAAPVGAQTPVHPLDQLSAREHWAIYDALQGSWTWRRRSC